MTKEEIIDKLTQAEKLIDEVATFIYSLEDDGEFKLSILAELTDAEEYVSEGKRKVTEDYDKLKIRREAL